MQQLDIFNDSRDQQLRNDLAAACLSGDHERSGRARQALADEYPQDPALMQADRVIAWQTALTARALDTPTLALAARRELAEDVAPLALCLLGAADGEHWLRRQWRQLALKAASLPFQPDHAEAHAASLWLQAAAASEAAEAVRGIESWRRIPQPLAWMLQAQWLSAAGGPSDSAWILLAELCWLAPQRAAEAMRRLPDAGLHKRLHKRLRRFETEFGEMVDLADAHSELAVGRTALSWPAALAWFPAWLLVDQPLMADTLGAAVADGGTPAQRGYLGVRSLLRLEQQGRHHDIVEQRRALRSLCPPLFACYMKTR